jgi:glycosyltransferase involved in cell wall biosynthesis
MSDQSPTLLLSSYPVPQATVRAVRDRFGAPVRALAAADLRSMGLGGLMREFMRNPCRRAIVATSFGGEDGFGPILRLVAACWGWPTIHSIDAEGRIREVSRMGLVPELFGLAGASLEGIATRNRLARQAVRLRARPRQPWRPGKFAWRGQRVLYVRNLLSFGVQAGGSVGHVAGVANGFRRAGAAVTMLSPDSVAMLDPSITVERPAPLRHLAMPMSMNVSRLQARAVQAGLAVGSSFRPTLIYQRLALGDSTGAMLAERLGIPLVVEYNGSEIWASKHWGGGRTFAQDFHLAEELMIERADALVTISEVLRDELVSRGVPESRVAWYPNCIDPGVFCPQRFQPAETDALRARLGIPLGSTVITFLGTFGDWHGAEVFATAAAQIATDSSLAKMHFLFIGDGRRRRQCEETMAPAVTAGRATFAGLVPQHEAPLYLAASDIFVSPHVPNPDGTRFFGSPTKLFEYMAMQRPIIASRLEQVGEVLSHGKTALLVTPGDVGELAAAIRRLHADPALGVSISEASRAEALMKYTWDTHVEHIAQCIAAI